ncbi:MAG: hypothetical protein QNK05_10280, partial [Myxococcota bacterium]|nr:hypothetical protein [Myxococcota bacterium]
WLVERHVRPLFEQMQSRIADAQAEGIVRAGDPLHVAYLLVGASAFFSQSAEFEELSGRDARSPEVIQTHVDLVLRLLLPDTAAEEAS